MPQPDNNSPWEHPEAPEESHTQMTLFLIESPDKPLHESESVSCSVLSNSEASWTIAFKAPQSMGFPSQEY